MRLRVGIDVGGTFTDLVAVESSSGERNIVKTASTPRAPEEGVLAALDELFARFAQPPEIEYLAHSTTIATNALLGQIHLDMPRVVFVTTEGFRDVIEIGRQNRSEVYNLFVTRPAPLAARNDRVTVRERIDYRGRVLVPLDDEEIARAVARVQAREPDCVAIGFLHSYVNDGHERAMARALESALPGVPVTCSAAIDPEYREYERFSTAVVNAALLPIVRGYLQRLSAALGKRGINAPLYVMQSSGGMATAKRAAELPAAMIESGPASGTIAAADLARRAGIEHALAFDMGGTTAKAGTIITGDIQVATEFEAAGATHSGRAIKGSGYPVRFPFVDLAEISAGGGTIASIDSGGALQVGPLSAGADPGPACYGKSESATVTDANVVLGRLNREALLGGTFAIDAARSHAAIAALAKRLNLGVEETAEGIVKIVDAQMAKVLRIVTVERGLDPREFALVAFGGNGALHACALAEELSIARILVPQRPGVFSADGLLVAPLRGAHVRPLLQSTRDIEHMQLERIFRELEHEARSALREQGAPEAAIRTRREYDARYAGQSFEIAIGHHADMAAIETGFHAAHERRYGYAAREEAVELVNARLTAFAAAPGLPQRAANGAAEIRRQRSGTRSVWIDGAYQDVSVCDRAALTGTAISGPAIVEQYDATIWVAPHWRASAGDGIVAIER